MIKPISEKQLTDTRDWIQDCRIRGDLTVGDIYARDLLDEVDRLRQILAALAAPSDELVTTAAQAWRAQRANAGLLSENAPLRPTSSMITLTRDVLTSTLPALLAALGETETRSTEKVVADRLSAFFREVVAAAKSYTDDESCVIAELPFMAELDQIADVKYGIALDGGGR
ncbi:hypothetical protein EDD29_0139 [Actinocorallia herbida]|uniref:Uncharacterized protein n=1 Tax=Actinocorallia herbida TaxID=58109 RepID=A0A3N1CPK5_9ACTN|nr:hypothetical protein [Actinocorallia herbida]ROO82658.1 hypothetical protein EDD29_0139 [Actinocorallia herbida]